MPVDPLSRVRRAKARRERAGIEWRAAIQAARAAGVSSQKVADAAGVSQPRIVQITRH